MSRDLDSLIDILDASQRLALHIEGMDAAAFETDAKTQDAVIRCLEIIGEATKRLSPELRQRYPQISWQTMAGMRDVLIHAYDKVDVDVVWETTTKAIPSLIRSIEPIITAMSEDEAD